jgi:hypothetical protein
VVVASTAVEAAATAAADTGKSRLLARNEKPALLRQAGFLHAFPGLKSEARRALCRGESAFHRTGPPAYFAAVPH